MTTEEYIRKQFKQYRHFQDSFEINYSGSWIRGSKTYTYSQMYFEIEKDLKKRTKRIIEKVAKEILDNQHYGYQP